MVRWVCFNTSFDLREKLGLEGGVAGVSDDEGAEHSSDSSARSGDSDGSSSGTNELGGGVNVPVSDGDRQRAEGCFNFEFQNRWINKKYSNPFPKPPLVTTGFDIYYHIQV